MTFWIIIALLAISVALLLGIALLRTRDTDESAAAYDLRVYRDQLKEVDRDIARGVMSAEDGARSKSEIGRRVLAADAAVNEDTPKSTQPRRATIIMTVLTTATVIGGSLLLYRDMGAPGYSDVALMDRIATAENMRANRPSQKAMEARLSDRPAPAKPSAEFADLMERLRAATTTYPDDLKGQTLLARNEMSLGNFKAAYLAQENILRIKADAARSADYGDYGKMLILATNGYISPEAETALRAAIARDPKDGISLYYLGLMFSQNDRPDAAFRLWRRLLDDGPASALWIAPVRAQIPDMARRAGVNYTLPTLSTLPKTDALAGPTAADLANAQTLNDDERQDMIRGMVSQLSDRLATDGGSAAEWARLIGALSVLGDTDRAAAIYSEAKTIFATKPDDLSLIRGAALRAGLAE